MCSSFCGHLTTVIITIAMGGCLGRVDPSTMSAQELEELIRRLELVVTRLETAENRDGGAASSGWWII